MTVYIRLATRIFAGDEGLREWVEFASQDSSATLVIAGAGTAQRGVVLNDIVDGLKFAKPRLEIRRVEHPRIDQARELNRILFEGAYSRVVAIGGGSILDLAKAALYLKIHWGFEEAANNSVTEGSVPAQLVAVPTTLSGAEVNPGFGIVDDNHVKKVFWDERLAPEVVICHPEAFGKAPSGLIAASGVNALAHCLEGLYTRARDPLCDPLALDSIDRLVRWLPETKHRDPSRRATLELQRASAEAGWVAFGSKPALHHAICHVLGSRLGIKHAVANVIMLPHVLGTVPQEAWGEALERVLSIFRESLPGTSGGIIDLVRAFIGSLFDNPMRLRNVVQDQSQLQALAEVVAKQQLTLNHPVSIRAGAVERLLQEAW